MKTFDKNRQYVKFCAYGFLKNLRFFDAFLLLFFLEKGLSYTEIGVIYATREIVINFSEIPSGIVADTFGRKNALVGAFLSYIISFLIFYQSSDFYLFLLAIILYGIGDAFRSGTHKGMIMDYLRLNNWENQKVHYYGHTRSWSQFGSALSALFAGFLVLYFGTYRNVFLFSIIPYLLNFINIFTYPEEINFSLSGKKKTESKQLTSTFKSFFTAVRQPGVFRIMNSTALHSAYLKAIKDYIQPVMVNVAILIPFAIITDPTRKSGLIIGVIYFFIFLLTSFASRNSGRVAELKIKNIPKLTLLAGFTAGITCGVLFSFELWVLALITFISIYVLENIRKPILTGEIADNVPNEILTSVISAQSFYQTILTSGIALSLGILTDHLGLGMAFVAISVFLFLFTIITKSTNLKPAD